MRLLLILQGLLLCLAEGTFQARRSIGTETSGAVVSFSEEVSTYVGFMSKGEQIGFSEVAARDYPTWLSTSFLGRMFRLRWTPANDGSGGGEIRCLGVNILAFGPPEKIDSYVARAMAGGLLTIPGSDSGCLEFQWSCDGMSSHFCTRLVAYRPAIAGGQGQLLRACGGKVIYTQTQAPLHTFVMKCFHGHTQRAMQEVAPKRKPRAE